jgi:hypothetical protein
LEVLAGVRTPANAAAWLSVTVPRYYLWEQRALEGLVMACEPRPVGKTASLQGRVAALQKEIGKLKQENLRQQALVRASQRTIGLPPIPQPKPVTNTPGKAAGKKPRKRRPVVRALKAAAALRAASDEVPSGATSAEVLQRSVASCPMLPSVPDLPAMAAGGE